MRGTYACMDACDCVWMHAFEMHVLRMCVVRALFVLCAHLHYCVVLVLVLVLVRGVGVGAGGNTVRTP